MPSSQSSVTGVIRREASLNQREDSTPAYPVSVGGVDVDDGEPHVGRLVDGGLVKGPEAGAAGVTHHADGHGGRGSHVRLGGVVGNHLQLNSERRRGVTDIALTPQGVCDGVPVSHKSSVTPNTKRVLGCSDSTQNYREVQKGFPDYSVHTGKVITT